MDVQLFPAWRSRSERQKIAEDQTAIRRRITMHLIREANFYNRSQPISTPESLRIPTDRKIAQSSQRKRVLLHTRCEIEDQTIRAGFLHIFKI